MDDQDVVEFSSASGLLVHPSGPGGPVVRLEGKKRWKATLSKATPARIGFRAVLHTLPTRDFAAVRDAARAFEGQGVATARLELGTLFSFQGTIFDSRQTLVCAKEVFATSQDAHSFLRRLEKNHAGDYRVNEVLDKRPQGVITLTDKRGTVRIQAHNAIWFQPGGDSLTIHDVEYAKGFSWHGRKTRKYAGSFYLAVDRHGKLAVVNVLPAEKLLRGLVPAEIYPDAPDAALQAQAISARNELFSKIGHRHLADPYLICADQHCQVYKGLDAERGRASRAVRKTRGQVIFDETGSLADIRYHSTCGGHTENAAEAWPGVTSPNLIGRWDRTTPPAKARTPVADGEVARFLAQPPDSYCGRSRRSRKTFRWSRTFSPGKMDQLVGKRHDIGRGERLEILHRGVSGRVNKVRLTGSKSQVVVDGELTIRRLLGGLKSSLFVIESAPEGAGRSGAWRLKGGGSVTGWECASSVPSRWPRKARLQPRFSSSTTTGLRSNESIEPGA